MVTDHRVASVERRTSETSVELTLNLDGEGNSSVDTGIGALDHFLTLFSRHGKFDINLKAAGDLEVDPHHSVEDVAICLGQALCQALGERRGIRRMADASVPMDEALAHVAVDCSGRGYYVQRDAICGVSVGQIEVDLFRHFFETFATEARLNLHVVTLYGLNGHHQVEAMFKATARALSAAVSLDPREGNRIPSTKGHIEI